jgi:hypothetical protein
MNGYGQMVEDWLDGYGNPKMIKKRRTISPEVQAKGAAALALWRKGKAAAAKKGGKALAKWIAEEELKKAQKRTSPMMAIKAFCNNCVGDIRADITNCTSLKCPLYIYRPYQKESDE